MCLLFRVGTVSFVCFACILKMWKWTYFCIHFPTYHWSSFEVQKEAKNMIGLRRGWPQEHVWPDIRLSHQKEEALLPWFFHLKIRNCPVSQQTGTEELGSIGQDHKKSKPLWKPEHKVIILDMTLVSSMSSYKSSSSIFFLRRVSFSFSTNILWIAHSQTLKEMPGEYD